MSLSKLPRELILDIGESLPTSSLSCLLQTCHSLQQLLWPALTTRITTENLESSVLQWGIQHNLFPTVELALAHNATWHTQEVRANCYSALADACGRNHLDIVAALLTHFGPSIVRTNEQPNGQFCHVNQLEVAIRSNNLACTTLLLEGGALANRTMWYGFRGNDKSMLGLAAMYRSAEIAEVLIKHGAEVGRADRSLCYAVDNGRWDVVKVLLREAVSVWEHLFEWSDYCPLGERTPEEVEAWVAAGAAYMQQ